MKHIKTYEGRKNVRPKVGEYVIWKDKVYNTYEILLITRIDGPPKIKTYRYWSRTIYIFKNNELEELEYNETEQYFSNVDIKDGTVPYISENLDDCIAMIYLMADLNKYNL